MAKDAVKELDNKVTDLMTTIALECILSGDVDMMSMFACVQSNIEHFRKSIFQELPEEAEEVYTMAYNAMLAARQGNIATATTIAETLRETHGGD